MLLRAPAYSAHGGAAMERMLEPCAGLDVHKKTHHDGRVARPPRLAGRARRHSRRDGKHRGLLAARLLRPGGRVPLRSRQRRADRPSAWPQDRREGLRCGSPNSSHGLIRASFVPPAPIRELRDLTRYRKVLIQERYQLTERQLTQCLFAQIIRRIEQLAWHPT